jgi:hypothetical protein
MFYLSHFMAMIQEIVETVAAAYGMLEILRAQITTGS